jgi:hypothetical protein
MRRVVNPAVALAFVVTVSFSASLEACRHWPCEPDARCWEDTAFPYSIATATVASGAMPLAQKLRAFNRELCSEPETDLVQKTCNDTFQSEVLAAHCANLVEKYCDQRCPADQDQCKSTGSATVIRHCGAASLAEFKALMPYCADLELLETNLVERAGAPAQPRCAGP